MAATVTVGGGPEDLAADGIALGCFLEGGGSIVDAVIAETRVRAGSSITSKFTLGIDELLEAGERFEC